MHTKYRLRKSKMHYFWYQKRTKTDTGLFFSDTISMKTSKLVASSEFLPKKWTLHQKVQFSHEQIAKKVQSTVVGTKMLQICCKCEKAYRMRKMQICCKFEIAYIHIWLCFAAPTSKGYTKLSASSRFLLMAMKCTPSTGCERVKCTIFGTKKGPKQIQGCFSLTLLAWKPQN